ncbi:hypothetical protein Q3A66_17120 [Hymenobacter sp. BT770]|uniref:hypothetical protein n=1 Tax=Hymenobacter sp. BT770 TaxID=2886942 RepID=UPI001D113592|nr:hypothetical protein [Hymenobacter sp. BT770]MCC3154833.1 hypothetical protein [Hymenobacter sp. BT770]MDO3416792.1 hypothetical protein [Hymenobacter sp. BT770]
MKHLVLLTAWLGLVLGGYSSAQAQTKAPAPGGAAPAAAPRYQVGRLSTDPAQYIIDVQSMMASTNNAAARAMGARLRELWGTNRLTSSQQARIVALSQVMLAKKFRPRPHFEQLYAAIIGGANSTKLTDQQMDQYLDVLGQTLEKEAPQETEKFIFSTSRFLNGGYFYRSGYSSLRAVGGTISFAYSPIAAPVSNLEFGASAPAPKDEPLPAAKKPVAAAKTPAKAAPKPAAPKPKKKASSSGWDTADMWSSPSGGGWGDSDDGWGAPVKKKAPAKKPVAKTATKASPTAAPVKAAAATAKAADFEPPTASFTPSALPYDDYMAPPARGAVIVVKDADLHMGTAGDSVVLKKVSGTAVPNSGRFLATGGQFAWVIKGNPVTADLAGFDFDMSKPEFTVQPVTLTYPAVLEAPVKGALSYKSVRRKPGATDTGYPRFISLTNDARIKNLGENIQYRGGLSMAGGKVLSAALDGSPSNLFVSLGGKPKFKASSRAYVLGDSVITANRAAVTIYEGAKDSVTHPGTQLKYLKGKQQLKLAREEGLYKNTPYSDSYHQMDIRTEALTWNLNSPTIDFAVLSAKNQQTADFESKEFFTNSRYQQLKSINRLHPLQMLVGYSQSHGNAKTLNVSTLATDLQTSEPNMRSAMAGLARDGYVEWNPQTGDVTILPKGAHYVASARDKKDYDHIAIKSLSGSGRNATLNLNTNELTVRGVDRFNFSDDSATVFVRPDSAIIRIQKNRNINFNGTVVASAMRFKGREFKFDYDGFYVDMAKIDSIVIRSEAKDAKGKPTGKHADFALTNKGKVSTGRLFLNDPKNKSGRKKKGQYPAFDSKSGANVYFRKQDVLGGAYDSTMVFDIPPFKLDSLNGIGKTATGFNGTFRSGGIIPDIQTKLTVQEDGSLGFVYDVPKDGFPLYKGRGRVFNKVKMNGKGLQGDGTITYQSGTFTSNSFVFYRDSVVTVGRTGAIAAKKAEGVDIPKMSLPTGYLMNWNVRRDSMFLTTPRTGEAIRMYTAADQKTKTVTAYNFKGTAVLTPKNVGGDGRLDGPQSFIKSPAFTFKTDSYSGRKATVSIKSAEANKPALTANDVAFDYNLSRGFADFKREEGSKASIDLPYSKFKTTLSGGHWDFKKKQVVLRVAANADSTKSYFYSTNPDQQGLKFKASSGVYDLAKYRMQVGGVPYIAAADAWITPDSGKVSIGANGRIQRFRNAGVVLDSLDKFHHLVKGNVEVLSKAAFTGNAEYTIKTARDSVALRFGNFEPDPAAILAGKGRAARKNKDEFAGAATVGPPTVATAVVSPGSKFQLTPRIGYRGNVLLNSRRRGFAFDGQVQLQFGKDRKSAEWIAMKDSIDPKNFSLNLKDIKAEDGSPLVTGLFMSDQTNKVYPLYAATLPNNTDVSILKVDGQLRYDDKKGIYTISRNDLSDVNAYEGAMLAYTDATNSLSFRGPMTFINSNKNYKLVGSGVGTANPDSARYSIDALLGFDIGMPEKAVAAMGTELARVTKGSPEALDGSTNELYKLGQFIGNKGVEEYTMRKGATADLMKLSPKLMHTIMLSKVDLRWSEKRRAWYSVGKLGLAGVGKQPLNALIDGHVEIRRENNTDLVEIYLEPEPQTWYYFKYANNLLLAKSSSENFDAEVGGKAKGDYNTATSYGAFLGDFTDVDAFRSHFQRDYLGKSGKLTARPAAPAPSTFDTFEGKKGKKKKGQEDAFGTTDPNAAPAADAAPEPTKKKKKAKANDPFGDGVMEDPNAPAATAEPANKKEKVKVKAADTPAAADATEPDLKKVKTKTKAADAAPDAEAAPDPAQDKKEAARLAKEAEKQKKEEEKRKKEEEKKKKKATEDPFGDS